MSTPYEARSPTVEDFLEPNPETLAALGDALHGLRGYAGESRPMIIGGREYTHSAVNERFNNGTAIQASWLEGGDSASIAELPDDSMVTHVHLLSGGVRVNYSLSSKGEPRLVILKPGEGFPEGIGKKPPGTNKPTEAGTKTFTYAINDALESGLLDKETGQA